MRHPCNPTIRPSAHSSSWRSCSAGSRRARLRPTSSPPSFRKPSPMIPVSRRNRFSASLHRVEPLQLSPGHHGCAKPGHRRKLGRNQGPLSLAGMGVAAPAPEARARVTRRLRLRPARSCPLHDPLRSEEPHLRRPLARTKTTNPTTPFTAQSTTRGRRSGGRAPFSGRTPYLASRAKLPSLLASLSDHVKARITRLLSSPPSGQRIGPDELYLRGPPAMGPGQTRRAAGRQVRGPAFRKHDPATHDRAPAASGQSDLAPLHPQPPQIGLSLRPPHPVHGLLRRRLMDYTLLCKAYKATPACSAPIVCRSGGSSGRCCGSRGNGVRGRRSWPCGSGPMVRFGRMFGGS